MPKPTNHEEKRLYWVWVAIKQRCLNPENPAFKNYGGRGITLHPEWAESFQAFKDAVGPKPSPAHTLDREQNELGYQPGNLRWATRKVQALNRRGLCLLTFNGETLALTAWADKLGLSPKTLRARLEDGWPLDKALQTPSGLVPTGRKPNLLLEHAGETLPLAEWSERVGQTAESIRARLNRGWPVEAALMLPAGARLPRSRPTPPPKERNCAEFSARD